MVFIIGETLDPNIPDLQLTSGAHWHVFVGGFHCLSSFYTCVEGIIYRGKLSLICAIKRALMDRMTMGSLRSRTIAGWTLEFVLRQPINDWIVNRLVTVLPLPDEDICLKKSILLRRISSEVSKGTISEKILDSLEMVEELDSISPMISSETAKSSMRTAYGYVVVASILSFNPDDEAGDYYSAMQRIWTERINKMELMLERGDEGVGGSGCGSGRWERVHTYELRKEVVRVALESLRAFLVITARDLGLPFLGAVSGYVQWKYHDLDGFRRSVVSSTLETDQRGCAPMPEDNISSPGQPPSNGCGPKQEASAALMQGDAPNGNGGVSHVPMIGDSNLGDGIRLMQTQAIHNV
ncbi:hypothetical protein EJ110_NYTH48498 [Nymphaea thermarum]|nr:hypothetical protein EJ110_NYTH48498 [Nymphaea thermarum]